MSPVVAIVQQPTVYMVKTNLDMFITCTSDVISTGLYTSGNDEHFGHVVTDIISNESASAFSLPAIDS